MKINVNLQNSLMILAAASISTALYAAPKKSKKKASPSAAPAATETTTPATTTEESSSAPAATAEASPEKKGHRAPYGMAGCGLGSLVIKGPSAGPQIGAGILNVTGVQTSAISSGTSNCKVSKEDLAQVEQETFIQVNLASLAKDASQGQGEHLTSFAEILGCGEGNAFDVFSQVSRTEYERIFQGHDAKVVLSNYKAVIHKNETLAKSCVRA